VDVLGRGGVPSSGVGAVIVSVAAVDAAGAGFLTVHPDGEPRPNSSSLNTSAGGTVANQVVAKLGADGRFVVFSSVRTDLIVDVVGWLPVGSDFAAVTPSTVARRAAAACLPAPRSTSRSVAGPACPRAVPAR
jgi:hypothetical protein